VVLCTFYGIQVAFDSSGKTIAVNGKTFPLKSFTGRSAAEKPVLLISNGKTQQIEGADKHTALATVNPWFGDLKYNKKDFPIAFPIMLPSAPEISMALNIKTGVIDPIKQFYDVKDYLTTVLESINNGKSPPKTFAMSYDTVEIVKRLDKISQYLDSFNVPAKPTIPDRIPLQDLKTRGPDYVRANQEHLVQLQTVKDYLEAQKKQVDDFEAVASEFRRALSELIAKVGEIDVFSHSLFLEYLSFDQTIVKRLAALQDQAKGKVSEYASALNHRSPELNKQNETLRKWITNYDQVLRQINEQVNAISRSQYLPGLPSGGAPGTTINGKMTPMIPGEYRLTR
jgi:hypothetical protein